ncbi:MAG: hypothetical protein H7249_00680 [Chitinophagaceae bacterium]|nr:hypothetical protein [Oligoflexus sp.]
MTLPRWDEDMKFELLKLKSELRPENFRVLHAPLGLGRLTKSDAVTALKEPVFPHLALPQHPEGILDTNKGTSSKAIEARLAAIPSLPELPSHATVSLSRRFSKLLIIHTLDVGFVVMTVALGLLLASWLIDPSHVSENPELLKQATPIRFLAESNAVTIVLGLYGFFSLYWLFFKLVSGSTLGESFLDNFWSLQNPRRTALGKDSGDS